MRRRAVLTIAMAALALAATASPVPAQSTFKVPFKFESGPKKFPAGEYLVSRTGDGQLTFKQVATEKETIVPFTETLKAPDAAPGAAPSATPPASVLVFDEVGNFEPSYTEYFTVYVLAEVWLSASDGYLIHTTKGAHKNKIVRGEAAKK